MNPKNATIRVDGLEPDLNARRAGLCFFCRSAKNMEYWLPLPMIVVSTQDRAGNRSEQFAAFGAPAV